MFISPGRAIRKRWLRKSRTRPGRICLRSFLQNPIQMIMMSFLISRRKSRTAMPVRLSRIRWICRVMTRFFWDPIWWGIAAWPVDSFVENNDFTGKTVIPFATSASSGLGESGQLLADMAGTGDWQEGMRFRSGADEADVQEWVNGLGL